jgi:hypothetical protein
MRAPSHDRHGRHAKLETRSLLSLHPPPLLTSVARGLALIARIHPVAPRSISRPTAPAPPTATAIDEHTSELSNSPCRPPPAPPIPDLDSQGDAESASPLLFVKQSPQHPSSTSPELLNPESFASSLSVPSPSKRSPLRVRGELISLSRPLSTASAPCGSILSNAGEVPANAPSTWHCSDDPIPPNHLQPSDQGWTTLIRTYPFATIFAKDPLTFFLLLAAVLVSVLKSDFIYFNS